MSIMFVDFKVLENNKNVIIKNNMGRVVNILLKSYRYGCRLLLLIDEIFLKLNKSLDRSANIFPKMLWKIKLLLPHSLLHKMLQNQPATEN